MTRRISFLTGKPVRPGTVLSELHRHLQSLRSDVAIHVVTDAVLPSPLLDSTLIVQRALGPPQLSAALRLEEAGIRCCNGITATIAVRHRMLTLRSLVPHGVRVPATTLAESWQQVLDQANQAPVVVKTATELTGRGRGVLKAGNGTLPRQPPFMGPYLIQEFITCDSRDYKVYVVGDQVQGLLKGQSPESGQPLAELFAVDRDLAELARRVGKALHLEIYGVDFLYGPDGPVVVDVNPFPGFRGLPQASRIIVDYLMTL